MIDNLTPSDLIYLYLDGEADSMQQTTMFAALATDSDLQQEFNEALSMRKAFARERTSTKPPMYLTTRVFRDAGVISSAVGAGAAGGAIWMWLRRMTVPVSSVLVGSIITFFGMQQYFKGNVEQQLAAATIDGPNQSIQPKGNPEPPQTPTFAKEEAVEQPMKSTHQRFRGSGPKTTESLATNGGEHLSSQVVVSEDENTPFTQDRTVLSYADSYSSSFGRRNIQMVNVASSMFNPRGKASDWTLEVNRLASVNLYGGIPGQNLVNVGSNVSASLIYNLDENSSFLTNVGHSQYNVSAVTSSGVTQNPSYYTVTLGYKYTATELEILGAEPFGQIAAGFGFNSASNDPVINATMGLSFPLWIARFNTGLDIRGLRYTSASGAQLSTTIGLVAGFGFNF